MPPRPPLPPAGEEGAVEQMGPIGRAAAIAARVESAQCLEGLKAAAAGVDEMVRVLHGEGVAIEQIAQGVSTLNRRIFARLWAMTAPAPLVANSCLLIMGSEGRGEQILKTDQDNALLLRDGLCWPGLDDVTARFNAALIELGWPPCPGGIMVTNPLWCQPLAAFRETMRGWVYGQGADAALAAEGPLHLAIFFDATAVAGDATLLQEARAHLAQLLNGADIFLARFAAAADQFSEVQRSLFARLLQLVGAAGSGSHEPPLDVKKLGIFPIVHGVRALALQYGLSAQSTPGRLEALAAAGRLEVAQARELRDSLHALMALRLTLQLRQQARGERAGNEVHMAELAAPEREVLQQALATVKRFRAWLRPHFHLDQL